MQLPHIVYIIPCTIGFKIIGKKANTTCKTIRKHYRLFIPTNPGSGIVATFRKFRICQGLDIGQCHVGELCTVCSPRQIGVSRTPNKTKKRKVVKVSRVINISNFHTL